ncbi:hypothetical protein PMI08_01910, partial [Brevibacillus sp. CF112]
MKRFRFDRQAGKEIERFDSVSAVFSRIVRTDEPVSIGWVHLQAGG